MSYIPLLCYNYYSIWELEHSTASINVCFGLLIHRWKWISGGLVAKIIWILVTPYYTAPTSTQYPVYSFQSSLQSASDCRALEHTGHRVAASNLRLKFPTHPIVPPGSTME